VIYNVVGETMVSLEEQLEGALGLAYTNCKQRVHKALDTLDPPQPPQPPHDQPR
jgi:hypothetical protein